ncbi:MAG: hypothetical protein ACXW6T_24060 [Candidatus Binatia bacterium]
MAQLYTNNPLRESMKLNNASLQTAGLLIFRLEVVSPSVITAEAGIEISFSAAAEVSDKDWMPVRAGMADLHFG